MTTQIPPEYDTVAGHRGRVVPFLGILLLLAGFVAWRKYCCSEGPDPVAASLSAGRLAPDTDRTAEITHAVTIGGHRSDASPYSSPATVLAQSPDSRQALPSPAPPVQHPTANPSSSATTSRIAVSQPGSEDLPTYSITPRVYSAAEDSERPAENAAAAESSDQLAAASNPPLTLAPGDSGFTADSNPTNEPPLENATSQQASGDSISDAPASDDLDASGRATPPAAPPVAAVANSPNDLRAPSAEQPAGQQNSEPAPPETTSPPQADATSEVPRQPIDHSETTTGVEPPTADGAAPAGDPPQEISDSPEVPAESQPSQIRVQSGDSFWTLAQRAYENAAFYKALYQYNLDRLDTEGRLCVGQMIDVPALAVLYKRFPELCPPQPSENPLNQKGAAATRVYLVKPGDTLFEIARFQLGDARRWSEILRLNREQLGSSFYELQEGTQLTLPAAETR